MCIKRGRGFQKIIKNNWKTQRVAAPQRNHCALLAAQFPCLSAANRRALFLSSSSSSSPPPGFHGAGNPAKTKTELSDLPSLPPPPPKWKKARVTNENQLGSSRFRVLFEFSVSLSLFFSLFCLFSSRARVINRVGIDGEGIFIDLGLRPCRTTRRRSSWLPLLARGFPEFFFLFWELLSVRLVLSPPRIVFFEDGWMDGWME